MKKNQGGLAGGHVDYSAQAEAVCIAKDMHTILRRRVRFWWGSGLRTLLNDLQPVQQQASKHSFCNRALVHPLIAV